jgi:hypothetical protein
VKFWKQWTGRLVFDVQCHDQIEEAVVASGISDPHHRIAAWSKTVTRMFNSLSEEERAQYTITAEQWNKEGPPLELKRRLVSFDISIELAFIMELL